MKGIGLGFICFLSLTPTPYSEGKASEKDTNSANGVSTSVLKPTWKYRLDQEYIQLQVLSSRDRVELLVNSQKTFFTKTLNNSLTDPLNTTNGLHVLVLNPRSGKLVMKRLFKTEIYAEGIGLPVLLNSLKSGEIVVFAVKYDASLNLSMELRRFLKTLGLWTTSRVVYRCYFISIFVNGGKVFMDTIIDDDPTKAGDVITSPITVNIPIPKNDQLSCWANIVDKTTLLRDKFCNNYGGYGSLCNCAIPMELDFDPPQIKRSTIENIPILIITKNRPQLLFKCLLTLLRQPGGHKKNIIVVIDGENEEVKDVLHLLQINYIVHHTEGLKLPPLGGRIGFHYQFALNVSKQAFPSSDLVIVIEDDILAAPDFLSFFNQTAPILRSDPSLYCINAWNELSAMHAGGSPHRLMRQETLPAYGWMTTWKFIEALSDKWPTEMKNYDWDIWFRSQPNRGTRECLVPEVSRSFHAGESGSHIQGQMTHSHITGHLSTAQQLIPLSGLLRLHESEYEEDLIAELESDNSVFLSTRLHPCHSKYIPRRPLNKTLVIFIEMTNNDDRRAWQRLASCLGVFNMDARNNHQGLFIFYFYGTRILAIGYPFSAYSYTKPTFITPLSAEFTEWDKSIRGLGYVSLMNRRRYRVPHMERLLPVPLLVDLPKGKPVVKYIY